MGINSSSITESLLTSSDGYFVGFARGILVPGSLGSSNYNILTVCRSTFTAGSPSYNAEYCQAFLSPGGGSQSIVTIDGQTVTVPLVAGFTYSIFCVQFNYATSVSDLQIFI
jgi:hypothetical protein